MTSFKTETEILLERYSWLQAIKKEKIVKQTNSDGEQEEVKITEVTDCKINASKLRDLLEDLGFFNYEIGGSSFLLRLINGAIEIWNEDKLRGFFDHEYIRSYPEKGLKDVSKEMLESKFLMSNENLLKDSIIKRLKPKKEIKFLEDTSTAAYFPYLNGIVKVTADTLSLIPYEKSEFVVFKTNILPRVFTEKMKTQWQKGNWYQFMKNIANGEGKNRIDNFQTVIGYLLHRYYERKLKSIILMDSRGSARDPKGRGGKSLLGKGMGYMLNADMKTDKVYCEIDGKNFESKKATKYQEAEINTSLIHLNDVERYGEFAFKLTSVYNDVLEGVKVRKLYQSPFHIRCKILISANHTFNTESGSTKDRFCEIQLSGYYDENRSPYDEFGKWFFSSDWSADDWNDFDCGMINCVQEYFRKGLRPPENINLDKLKAIEDTDPDFIEFMETKRLQGIICHNCEIEKSQLLKEFIQLYPEHERIDKNKKIWNKWLRAYTWYHDYFEKCTNDNLSKFDTQKRKESGEVVRVFKYYFNDEWLRKNTLAGK